MNRFWPVGPDKRKLNSDQLIDSAMKRTKLKDFGDDFDREALDVLVESINSEARLSPLGYLVMKGRLAGSLKMRLHANQLFKQHPEILEAEIPPIWLITGLQRTGTTFLQRLLSADPGARALYSWESLNPVPMNGRYETRYRIKEAKRSERGLAWLAPGFFAIHPIDHVAPEEDVLLLDASFYTTAPEAIMHVPSFSSWLESKGCRNGYEWEKKMLQLLHWQRPASRWILKSPHHLEFLEDFVDVFPNTSVIWTHRDPVSLCAQFSQYDHARPKHFL